MPHLLRRLVEYWPLTAILIGLPLVAAILYGCESRPQVVKDQTREDAGDICAGLLENGIDLVRPDSLGLVAADVSLESDPQQAARILSQWLRRPDCRAASPTEPLSDDAKVLIERLLGPTGVERLTAERLRPFDAAHIRDALLDFSSADQFVEGLETDLERVNKLFDYSVRTVSPEGTGTVDLLLTGYEAHLFGRGSAEARTWLFANLLRQLRIDAVVLRPSASPDADPNGIWWVGVPIAGNVYLYDTVNGIAVPASKDGSTQATWRQALETPELLTAYREEAGLEAAKISADDLATARVELIGPSAFWSKAIERLELSLTGDRGVLLYDPLHDTPAGTGLYSRILQAGEGIWDADSIGIWNYPEQVREQRDNLSQSQQQRLRQRIQPYLGPVEINTKEATPQAEPPSKQLWHARIGHMSGEPGVAIASYIQVRLAETDDPVLSPADQSLNSQAADEAFYWMIHAQYGAGEHAAAATTAESYIDDGGDRSEEAAVLRILSLAASGRTDEAATAVSELPETTPGLPRLRWLANVWSKPMTEAGSGDPE